MAKLEDYIIKPPEFGFKVVALTPNLSEADKERLIQLHEKIAEIQAAQKAALTQIVDEMLRISAKYTSHYVMVPKE